MEELQDQRIVEAELLAARLDRCRIDVATARAQANDADVAGDQAHQHETECRRSCQRRDRQQEPLYDVAMHLPRPAVPPVTCRARCWRGPGSGSGWVWLS